MFRLANANKDEKIRLDNFSKNALSLFQYVFTFHVLGNYSCFALNSLNLNESHEVDNEKKSFHCPLIKTKRIKQLFNISYFHLLVFLETNKDF